MSDAALQIAELSAALAAQTARAQAAEAALAQARALASCTDAMIQELKLEIAKLRRDKYARSSLVGPARRSVNHPLRSMRSRAVGPGPD